jgi:chorismate mutase / prephenate dehydratase
VRRGQSGDSPGGGYAASVPERKREVDELRQEIAKLDLHVLAALDKRARASRRIGELREQQTAVLPLTDHAAIRDLVGRSTGDMPEQALRDIFREIFSSCLSLELPAQIAYVGPEGGQGYVAARSHFGQSSGLFAVETTAGALDEVSRKRAAFAVVPFETSSEGPVHSTLVALVASDLRVAEMLDATFDLHLMSRSGNPAEVEKVYATPADHAACQRFLSARPAHSTVVDASTPRTACELAAEDSRSAAIANETFGTQLGLEVAERGILDRPGERVRYAVVGSRPSGRTAKNVTSLVFTVQDVAGSLLDVLKVLAERGISMTNIHSHPGRGEAWSYVFYLELAGHMTDRPLVTAFEEMKRMTQSFKVLGSYPST